MSRRVRTRATLEGGRPVVGKPQCCQRRLDRLVDHRKQLGGERVDVDRVAQPRAEHVDETTGVVTTAEVPVHDQLDVATGRVERGGDGEGRHRHDKVGAVRQQPAHATPTTTA